jgi:hypothetical protein
MAQQLQRNAQQKDENNRLTAGGREDRGPPGSPCGDIRSAPFEASAARFARLAIDRDSLVTITPSNGSGESAGRRRSTPSFDGPPAIFLAAGPVSGHFAVDREEGLELK